jgi:hypothetical protein
MSKSNKARQHEEVATKAVRHLKSRFFLHIRADVEGLPAPRLIEDSSLGGRFIPDISAGSPRDPMHFIEVETPATLKDGNGLERWEFFAKLAKKRGGHFRIAVPKESADLVRERLNGFGFPVQILEL